MPEPKVYLNKCTAKARQTSFGEVISLGCHADTLIAFIGEHTNERGYLNLNITPRRDVGKYGETHSVTLDTFKPNQSRGRSDATGHVDAPMSEPITDDDIPF